MPKPIYTAATSKQRKMEPNDPHDWTSPFHYDYSENNGKPYSFKVIVDEELLDSKLKTIRLESKDGVHYTLMVDGNDQGSFTIDASETIDNIHFDPTTNNLIFNFKDSSKAPIEVDLSKLQDLYTAGKGIQIDAANKKIEIKLDETKTDEGKNTLQVSDNGLYNPGAADPGTFD